jgi:hypothetical protein
MDDVFGIVKIVYTDRTPKMIGTPKCDMQSQFLIQENRMNGFDTKRFEDTKSQFRNITVSGFRSDFFQFFC